MVPVAVPSARRTLSGLGPESVSVSDSSLSPLSPVTGTRTVCVVVPGENVSVPEVMGPGMSEVPCLAFTWNLCVYPIN